MVTGAQFGDEGKGKMVDLLAEGYDFVVRFQGGDNAGHTVVVGGKKYKLHLIPSGVLTSARLLIGPGVVVNPLVLVREMDVLAEMGVEITPERLGIDLRASVIMPYHLRLDELRERGRAEKIGTTKRGIGFAYTDKIAREEIRIAELIDEEKFRRSLSELLPQKELLITGMGGDSTMSEEEIQAYLEAGRRLRAYVTDVTREVNQALDEGRRVLAEGAQGTYLDILHGTQKFVTSSSTIAGSACVNLGVGPGRVDKVIGVVKSYITRVGEGPLPTEETGEVGEHLQRRGGEFGTTTGRPRRCGWFDLPLARKAVQLNGYTGLALTKLDVLTGLDPVKICTRYLLNGEELDYPPLLAEDLARCKPVYQELEGWHQDLEDVRSFWDLPGPAKEYVKMLGSLLKVKIEHVSVGPERGQTLKC